VLKEAGTVRPAIAEACGLTPVFVGREWTIYRRLD
jgi:sugar (pentulose or hexulose) kinase